MSRIDEALRRAAKAEGLVTSRYPDPNTEARAITVEPSILERYAIERPMRRPDAVQPRPSRVAVSPRTAAPVRPITVPPRLEGKLVVSRDIAPITVEQYSRLAAVLHDYQLKQGLKTLMVSSATAGEGKTLTITNLALTLSESYRQRVLLVDADVRRPTVHEVLGIPNGAGLADVIAEGTGSLPVVEISPCLSVLTAGRRMARPLAMLTSDRLHTLVTDAAGRFDWVLLDTPPFGLLSDARLVARVSDGILFVIAAGRTPYALVQRAIAELGPERLVGTVLNRVEKRMLTVNDAYQGYYVTDAIDGEDRQ